MLQGKEIQCIMKAVSGKKKIWAFENGLQTGKQCEKMEERYEQETCCFDDFRWLWSE